MTLARKKSVDEIGGHLEFVAGLASGCITAVLTNPMDVVTSRLMTTDKHLYAGVSDCMRRLYMEEGPRVFMLGVKARVATIAPYTCIYLTVNEQMKRSLARCRGRGGDLLLEGRTVGEDGQSSEQVEVNTHIVGNPSHPHPDAHPASQVTQKPRGRKDM